LPKSEDLIENDFLVFEKDHSLNLSIFQEFSFLVNISRLENKLFSWRSISFWPQSDQKLMLTMYVS